MSNLGNIGLQQKPELKTHPYMGTKVDKDTMYQIALESTVTQLKRDYKCGVLLTG